MGGGFRTIGHSNRSLSEFIDLLREGGVETVADVRSFPRSRSNPAFNIEDLPGALDRSGIGYRHFPGLGGRRPVQAGTPEGLNALWRNQSFHNYADYALTGRFGSAYGELLDLGRDRIVGIMCSEAVWWRCHRRIITDYLLLDGREVIHLMGGGREEAAAPTPGVERTAAGKLVYPARAGGSPLR